VDARAGYGLTSALLMSSGRLIGRFRAPHKQVSISTLYASVSSYYLHVLLERLISTDLLLLALCFAVI
jgi:hypothetical protein